MKTTKITKTEEWTHPLFIAATNNSATLSDLKSSVKSFMWAVNYQAKQLAKANANWHDDPEGDPKGHKEMHAPAEIQFPPEIRRAVAMELFEYFLTEGGSI